MSALATTGRRQRIRFAEPCDTVAPRSQRFASHSTKSRFYFEALSGWRFKLVRLCSKGQQSWGLCSMRFLPHDAGLAHHRTPGSPTVGRRVRPTQDKAPLGGRTFCAGKGPFFQRRFFPVKPPCLKRRRTNVSSDRLNLPQVNPATRTPSAADPSRNKLPCWLNSESPRPPTFSAKCGDAFPLAERPCGIKRRLGNVRLPLPRFFLAKV